VAAVQRWQERVERDRTLNKHDNHIALDNMSQMVIYHYI